MQVNGLEGKKLARKKSLAVGVACMATYGPAPGLKGRTFELKLLTDGSTSASAVPYSELVSWYFEPRARNLHTCSHIS